jgi:hypothetical protein
MLFRLSNIARIDTIPTTSCVTHISDSSRNPTLETNGMEQVESIIASIADLLKKSIQFIVRIDDMIQLLLVTYT